MTDYLTCSTSYRPTKEILQQLYDDQPNLKQ